MKRRFVENSHEELAHFITRPAPPKAIRRVVPGDVLPEPPRYKRELDPVHYFDTADLVLFGLLLFLAGVLFTLVIMPR